jgi:hypothetical protein
LWNGAEQVMVLVDKEAWLFHGGVVDGHFPASSPFFAFSASPGADRHAKGGK